ncbi:TolC family protein [Paenimyroides aestuarii]|uniref:TolC family protein n=1 Tax=Paenimyroides aestuarii TaxID=2968490 RepID=A0ABY5NUE4_9FLAO|nr:TolC family protein [Paenimyroides aestuarii]UUV22155.1 TolC family protein [Paenimyroides aestuarii]
MKKRNKWVVTFLMFFCTFFVFGQDTLRMSHKEFISIVKSYHPLAYSYRLQNQIAEAEIQKARGNFDPLVDGKNGSKTIDGTQYYKETNVGLDIPTWYGIELSGSYNYINGEKLNNSDTKGGLYQFGVTLPLAKNLLYDKRRALLDQAKFALEMTQAEQRLLTNELLLNADNAYWNWVRLYENYLLQSQTVAVNEQRFILTKKTYEYGERAAIDTTEVASQLQSFVVEKENAYLSFLKATQELSLFLWTENQQPYNIEQLIVPSQRITQAESYDNYGVLLALIDQRSMNQHAALQYYQQKNNILESERRLKKQSLLPKLDFTYNFFNKENYRAELIPFFQNNYQYGLKLEIPLFLRQARADYKIAKYKIEQNQLDIDYKQQELQAKITAYKNEVLSYQTQIKVMQNNIENYKRLLYAEEIRFSNGESSLFLINSRENKLLEAEQKLLDLRLKFINSYNQLKWFNENFEG